MVSFWFAVNIRLHLWWKRGLDDNWTEELLCWVLGVKCHLSRVPGSWENIAQSALIEFPSEFLPAQFILSVAFLLTPPPAELPRAGSPILRSVLVSKNFLEISDLLGFSELARSQECHKQQTLSKPQ